MGTRLDHIMAAGGATGARVDGDAAVGCRSGGSSMGIDLERAYEQHLAMVRQRCQQLLGDREAAMDATQDVFLRLARRRDVLEDGPLGGLLYRMATGICLNRLRNHRARGTTPDDDVVLRVATARDFLGPLFAQQVLDTLFSRERESTRVMAVMHLRDGYTLQEVADEFDLTVSGVRSRLRTLRKHIHELKEVTR